MLAPRKTLWSTPDAVIERLIENVPLSATDRVLDIGCGDGRVLLMWASVYSTSVVLDTVSCDSLASFHGIDIDGDRIDCAKTQLQHAQNEGTIDSRISVTFHCCNALEGDCVDMMKGATVFFLYLIPRGLRKIMRLIRTNGGSRTIRVITYMTPLEGEIPFQIEKVQVPHQPGATWPLYFYRLDNASGGTGTVPTSGY